MTTDRQTLVDWIDADRERLIDFLQAFIRAKSPNPPGDTRQAVEHITNFLDQEGLEHEVVAPQAEMPNIVAAFGDPVRAKGQDDPNGGRHLVLNGHIDVFPVGEGHGWTADPWGGEIRDGKIFGRGACDMKCGTTASIFTYAYLHRLKDRLKGRLTLTCVSDEETFGPWGARWLIANRPDVHGDAMLNGEPGSPYNIRFGEKGPLWLRFNVRAKGVHGAYAHLSEGAVKTSMALIGELMALEDIEAKPSHNIARASDEARDYLNLARGEGASDVIPKVTVNIGTIEGGLKVNMIPDHCSFEADIRLPLGVEKETIMAEVIKIVGDRTDVEFEEINFTPPNWCDPYDDLAETISAVAKELKDIDTMPIVSLGTTDARLWRALGIPAFNYGPFAHGMGGADEHVEIEEFLHIVKTHTLVAYDFLMATG